ncbi:uncharacterized protein J3R85_006840 [Psidium guajava]|nr:uncharacterized protein J3R85_006840 [Psidium guajava]
MIPERLASTPSASVSELWCTSQPSSSISPSRFVPFSLSERLNLVRLPFSFVLCWFYQPSRPKNSRKVEFEVSCCHVSKRLVTKQVECRQPRFNWSKKTTG